MRMVRRLAWLGLAMTMLLAATPALAQQAATALNSGSRALSVEPQATTTFSFEQQTMRGYNLLAPQPGTASDDGIGFGILAGLSRSTISFDDALDINDTDGKSDWMLGIWFGGNRNGIVGFMGEMSLVKKGGNLDFGEAEIELSYLEFTAPIRINLGQRGNKWGLLFYPMVGPYVDILLKAEDQDDNDLEDFFNGFDAGVLLGAGVEVARFGFEVRYLIGFKSLGAEEDSSGFENLRDSENRSWQFIGKFRIN